MLIESKASGNGVSSSNFMRRTNGKNTMSAMSERMNSNSAKHRNNWGRMWGWSVSSDIRANDSVQRKPMTSQLEALITWTTYLCLHFEWTEVYLIEYTLRTDYCQFKTSKIVENSYNCAAYCCKQCCQWEGYTNCSEDLKIQSFSG